MTKPTAATIRPGTAEDVPEIHRMLRAMAEEMGELSRVSSTPADLLRHGFSGKACFQALIAEKEGNCVGFCLYFPSFSSWRGQPGVYVLDLYVAPGERGSGLAQEFMKRTAAEAGREGAVFMRLSVSHGNDAARRFYSGMGLHHSEQECVYMALGPAFEALRGIGASK